jgi:hypothetical protein
VETAAECMNGVRMTRFDRRVKIVSFRLSEREHRDLREFCMAHGIGSMSDLARRAIQRWSVGKGAADESVAIAIHELGGKVHALDAEFKQLARRLTRARSGQSSGEAV